MGNGVTCAKVSLVFLGFLGWSTLNLPAQTPVRETVEPGIKRLQQKVVERERPGVSATNAVSTAFGRSLTFQEIEQLFLDGKITARQFQEYVQKLPPPAVPAAPLPAAAAAPAAPAWPRSKTAVVTNTVAKEPTLFQGELNEEMQKKAVEILRATKPDPANNPKPGPAVQANQLPSFKEETLQSVDPIEQSFSEIEAKMDELLRWKAQRDSASQTNATPASSGGGGQAPSKRQRLDELLRLYIRGDIQEDEYKTRRAAIVAEPEAK